MSGKKGSKDTVRLKGKKHSIPLCMLMFSRCFEKIPEIERVGLGKFKPEKSNVSTLEIVGYDDLRSAFKVKIAYMGFLQYFYLEVKEDNKCYVQNKLEGSLNLN